MSTSPAAPSWFRRTIVRVLSAGYRDRANAKVFIADALDDRLAREGWIGAIGVIRVCAKDIVVTRVRPKGYPVTAAPITTSGARAASSRSNLMEQLIQDVRYGVRQLLRQPGFAAAAILTLAIGIGANAAVFRVAWQVMLKPLPYPSGEQLVRVWESYGKTGTINVVAPGNFLDWQSQSTAFSAMAAHSVFRASVDMTGAGEPEQLTVRRVTGDYFRVFGMPPLAGRWLDASDSKDDANTIVLSETFWSRRFGRDRGAIGRSIQLAGSSYNIVGIMPKEFNVEGGDVDAWGGYTLAPDAASRRGAHFLGVVGRLKPGVTLAQAIADVKRVAATTSAAFPDTNKNTSATVQSIADLRGGTMRSAIGMLMGAALLVLVIASANISSLQLARTVSRSREFGIRTALGATRGRLVVQLTTEGLLLGLLGAAAGLLLSSWILANLAPIAPTAIRAGLSAGIDVWTVMYILAMSVVSTVLFAAAPALRSAARAAHWIRQRTETADRSTSLLRNGLVTAQVGLALMLLVGAALLVTSLQRVLDVDPGFDPRGLVAFDLSLGAANVKDHADAARFYTRVSSELATVPGVLGTCVINEIPFDQTFNMTYVPDGSVAPVGAFPRTVTPDCIGVLKLRLVQGRAFTAHESARVAIVTERFAHAAWPGVSPIGKRVHLGVPEGALIEIVGVVADSLQTSLEARPYPQFYEVDSAEAAFPPTRMLVRTSAPPATMLTVVRNAVRRVDSNQPVARLRPLDAALSDTMASRRFDLELIGSFALVALVLAAIGIFGLLAHVFAQRAREIAIRMALGAAPSSVVRLMLRSAWLTIAPGLALGLFGAYAASGLMREFMFNVSTTAPSIYAASAVALCVVALAAAWIPVRRAVRVDPIEAMRD